LSLLGICIFWVDKFWNDTTSLIKIGTVLWNLEDQSVCVSWEMRVTNVICNITFFVPLSSENIVKLVVLNINDKFFV